MNCGNKDFREAGISHTDITDRKVFRSWNVGNMENSATDHFEFIDYDREFLHSSVQKALYVNR